ncbi:MAG: hypothetical protein EOP92_11790 [Lysobacteraceae bacterium]|nr:MAG: hypothetical protein EOP92_11790 [Xanthomonadaceae bacterium]
MATLENPRLRFWIATLIAPLAPLLVLFVAPPMHLSAQITGPCLLLAWLAGLSWIFSAHATRLGGWGNVSFVRALLVGVGFTCAASLLFFTSMAFLVFRQVAS